VPSSRIAHATARPTSAAPDSDEGARPAHARLPPAHELVPRAVVPTVNESRSRHGRAGPPGPLRRGEPLSRGPGGSVGVGWARELPSSAAAELHPTEVSHRSRVAKVGGGRPQPCAMAPSPVPPSRTLDFSRARRKVLARLSRLA